MGQQQTNDGLGWVAKLSVQFHDMHTARSSHEPPCTDEQSYPSYLARVHSRTLAWDNNGETWWAQNMAF